MSTKDKTSVGEVNLVASFTVRGKESTGMKKPLRSMVPMSFPYDIDFENSVQEHKLGAGEDINRKVDSVLVVPPYNVRRDRNAENSEYDVITSDDMRGIAKVLGDLMKPEFYDNVFCSSLPLDLYDKALVS